MIESAHILPLTASDLDRLVKLHMHIFEGYVGVQLGSKYVHKSLQWFIKDKASICLGAWHHDQLVGYVFGAPVGYNRLLSGYLLFPAIRGILFHPQVLLNMNTFHQIASRFRLLFLPKGQSSDDIKLPIPVFSLVGIGVSSEARGQGIGRTLVDQCCQLVTQHRFCSIRLSVYRNNHGAIRLYRSMGWRSYPHPSNPTLVYYATVLGKFDVYQ